VHRREGVREEEGAWRADGLAKKLHSLLPLAAEVARLGARALWACVHETGLPCLRLGACLSD